MVIWPTWSCLVSTTLWGNIVDTLVIYHKYVVTIVNALNFQVGFRSLGHLYSHYLVLYRLHLPCKSGLHSSILVDCCGFTLCTEWAKYRLFHHFQLNSSFSIPIRFLTECQSDPPSKYTFAPPCLQHLHFWISAPWGGGVGGVGQLFEQPFRGLSSSSSYVF